MAKKTEKDYFSCIITRPLYSARKRLLKVKSGSRFFIFEDKTLYIKTDKIIDGKLVCVSDDGTIKEFEKDRLVIHVRGVAYSFKKLSKEIVNDVKNDGHLLFRTDLYPDDPLSSSPSCELSSRSLK